jgi:glutaconate CoA-transferase subunit A
LDEHSHAGLVNRFLAGSCGLPFGVLRGYRGTDIPAHSSTISEVVCPFTGERLTAVAALNPDVAIIHAQRADRAGNVQLWGIIGAQKEVVLSARRSIVTVEEVVEQLDRRPGDVILPSWVVTAVAVVPGGAAPSYAAGYYERDNDAYRAWPERSRTREAFAQWLADLRERS